MPVINISTMKVADLKRELKIRGLSISGNKTELQERLQQAMMTDPILDDAALCSEDLLDEEEDAVLTDVEDKILDDSGSVENELLKSPGSLANNSSTLNTSISSADNLILASNSQNSQINDASGSSEKCLDSTREEEDNNTISPSNSSSQPKKIILNRKRSFTNLIVANHDQQMETTNSKMKKEEEQENKNGDGTMPSVEKVGNSSSPNTKDNKRPRITMGTNDVTTLNDPVEPLSKKKYSMLSAQERLELRAKKFGVTLTSPQETTKTTNSNLKAKKNNSQVVPVQDEKQLEILKKRAERFGCVTSTNLAKIDAQEKLLKRKERFALDTTTSSSSNAHNSSGSSDDWAEKAKKRLERFSANRPEITTVALEVKASVEN